MAVRISSSASVLLDANGRGTAQVSPGTTGWRVTRMTTSGTSAKPPSLTVRRGSASGPVVDTTRFGNLDTSETSLEVHAGESLWCVYEAGTAGATMVFYIEGESL